MADLFSFLIKGCKEGAPCVIVAHNSWEMGAGIADRLDRKGFHPHLVTNPKDAISQWERNQTGIGVIIAHKDIGDGRRGTIDELVEGVRRISGGDLVRIGIESGEIGYKRTTPKLKALKPDFAWDPTTCFRQTLIALFF